MSPRALVSLLLLPSLVQAAPRLLVMTAGDCENLQLESNGRGLYDAIHGLPPQQVVKPEELEALTFPRPSRSVEDLRRQLSLAENQFYEGKAPAAEQTLASALRDIHRLPPGEVRWELFRKSQLLASLVHFAQQHTEEANESLREIVRLDPGFRLEPNDYSERMRRQFESVRRAVANGPRVVLTVRSSAPNSEIFLNGRSQGSAPATLKLPPGRYHLQLRRGPQLGFPRWIELRGAEATVLVDMDFEAALRTDPFPCIQGEGDEATTQGHAFKAGALADASNVIVFRVEKPSDGSRWLAAASYDLQLGQKSREAGFKSLGVRAEPAALEALARYLTTGQPQPEIIVLDTSVAPPWRPEVSASQPAPPDPRRNLRVASYSVAGIGGAALVGGVVARVLAQNDVRALQTRLRPDGSLDPNDPTSVALVSGARTKNTLFITGMAVGGAAVVTAGVLFYLSHVVQSPVAVTVVPTPGGATFAAAGTF